MKSLNIMLFAGFFTLVSMSAEAGVFNACKGKVQNVSGRESLAQMQAECSKGEEIYCAWIAVRPKEVCGQYMNDINKRSWNKCVNDKIPSKYSGCSHLIRNWGAGSYVF